MSERQHYEFHALDHRLDDEACRALRAASSRATITPTSFVNTYSWGDFRGNVDTWMDRWFDAFLYVANWGAQTLKLKLAGNALDCEAYITDKHNAGVSARRRGAEVVLTFSVGEREPDDWMEGEGLLAQMTPIRRELQRGDLRALYLGWLLAVQEGVVDDDRLEPPVPDGLGKLSPPLQALVEFLRIDTDLIEVAARSSAPPPPPAASAEAAAWVASLSQADARRALSRLLIEDPGVVAAELHRSFDADRSRQPRSRSTPRTVRSLLDAAETLATERARQARERAAKEKASKQATAAAKRAAHLATLAGHEARLWDDVHALVAVTQPKNYDAAVTILLDLRDLAATAPDPTFDVRLAALRMDHGRKPSLLQRLAKAGL